jgi:hypothetical protein
MRPMEAPGPVTEPRRGVFTVAAVGLLCAVIGVSYWLDRSYRRWWKANHPFAGSLASIERLRAGYRQRRASSIEVLQMIWETYSEIASALDAHPSSGSPSAPSQGRISADP